MRKLLTFTKIARSLYVVDEGGVVVGDECLQECHLASRVVEYHARVLRLAPQKKRINIMKGKADEYVCLYRPSRQKHTQKVQKV